jgi:hypothetical protein
MWIFLLFIAAMAEPQKDIKVGRYTQPLQALTQRWLKGDSLKAALPMKSIFLQAIPTEGDENYVGVMVRFTGQGKIADLEKTFSDIQAYPQFYPDLEKIEANPPRGADQSIHWRFNGPFFSHVEYRTRQKITKIGANKLLISYNLTGGDQDILESDGLVFVEAVGDKLNYFSIDFFNAKWGKLAFLYKNKIWQTSCANTLKTTQEIFKASGIAYSSSSPDRANCSASLRQKAATFEKLSNDVFD